MGFLETMLLLAGLGGTMYFSVYYLIPAVQQMAYAPYYYFAQAAGQQQQPPLNVTTTPAAPAPATTDTSTPPAPAPAPAAPEEEVDTEDIENTVEDVLEDNGLVKDPPEENNDDNENDNDVEDSRTLTGEMSNEDVATFKAKRAQEGATAKRTAETTGFKRPGPSLMGLYTSASTASSIPKAKRKRFFYVDSFGTYHEL
jgi:hypothetical protein